MSEPFDDFRSWEDERDRLEFERRTSGFYEDVAELLADQPSPDHVRHMIQNLGDIDFDELPRTVRELAIRRSRSNAPPSTR